MVQVKRIILQVTGQKALVVLLGVMGDLSGQEPAISGFVDGSATIPIGGVIARNSRLTVWS